MTRPEEIAATPAVGEDEALMAEAQAWLCDNLTMNPNLHYVNVQRLATRLTAALADVARLQSVHSDLYNDNWRLRGIITQNDKDWQALRGELTEARAALAAAEQEKEKAVAEEREACARTIEKLYRDEKQGIDDGWDAFGVRRRTRERDAAAIRARAGRNDAG